MNTKINKQDLKNVSKQWILGSQQCWNYEKMMAPGYLNAISPILQKLYKDDHDSLKKYTNVHSQFFNTTPDMGGFILGMDIALEEQDAVRSEEGVTGIKTGLMGPFAGIGDTIFGVLIPTIMGSIAAYMALEGNFLGILLYILVNFIILLFRYKTVEIGYLQGTELIKNTSDGITSLTNSATVLGMTVIGALIPSVVRANIPLEFKIGESSLVIQEISDQIMPKLIPAIVVAALYYLLGKEKFNSNHAILLIIALSVILAALGILG